MVTDGFGELFLVDTLPVDKTNAIFLTFLENDPSGMKMTGELPILWELLGSELIGPNLYDDDHIYKVKKIDYEQNHIWIEMF